MVEFFTQKWVNTVLVLLLPCAVMFLVVRMILLSIAAFNRKLEAHRRFVEEQAKAEAAERKAIEPEGYFPACLSCGSRMDEGQHICTECGAIRG